MRTHWFTLTLAERIVDDYPIDSDPVRGSSAQLDEITGRLLAAGCDDGTIHSTGETLCVSFAREAESPEAAIQSATRAVEKAGFKVSQVVPEPEPA